jgi:hypothetical protein
MFLSNLGNLNDGEYTIALSDTCNIKIKVFKWIFSNN